jgi:hypothetical protein
VEHRISVTLMALISRGATFRTLLGVLPPLANARSQWPLRSSHLSMRGEPARGARHQAAAPYINIGD